MRNRRNKRKMQKVNKKVTIITALSIIIGLLFFSVIFSLINMGNNKIINGVKVEGIDVSNLSQEEANKKIEEIKKKDIVIYYEDLEETINMEDLNIKINIMNSTAEALKIGRSSNIVKDNYDILFTMLFQKKLNIEIEYDEEKIDKKIEEISNKLPGARVKTSYYIENEELIIKKGNDGLIIEKEKIKSSIKEAIKSTENKTIKIPVENEK